MTSSTTQLNADSSGKPIGFFSLPRELRDEIYDLLFEGYRTWTEDAIILGAVFIFKARTPLTT